MCMKIGSSWRVGWNVGLVLSWAKIWQRKGILVQCWSFLVWGMNGKGQRESSSLNTFIMIEIRFHNARRIKTLNHLIANRFLSPQFRCIRCIGEKDKCLLSEGWWVCAPRIQEYGLRGQTWSGVNSRMVSQVHLLMRLGQACICLVIFHWWWKSMCASVSNFESR